MALFKGDELVREHAVYELTDPAISDLLQGAIVKRTIVASTRRDAENEIRMLEKYCPCVMEFGFSTPVPIRNAYLTPETLGRDRLAAAVGVAALYPGRNVLVVDLGTAITIDLVSADATFRGGVITPGLDMRFRSLHEYTACLPLCGPACDRRLLGATTRQAIEAGVMNSVCFEIEGYMERLHREFDDLCVIFTGGDAKFFDKRIKNTIFAKCNPVFVGLNRILEYNVREEKLD